MTLYGIVEIWTLSEFSRRALIRAAEIGLGIPPRGLRNPGRNQQPEAPPHPGQPWGNPTPSGTGDQRTGSA